MCVFGPAGLCVAVGSTGSWFVGVCREILCCVGSCAYTMRASARTTCGPKLYALRVSTNRCAMGNASGDLGYVRTLYVWTYACTLRRVPGYERAAIRVRVDDLAEIDRLASEYGLNRTRYLTDAALGRLPEAELTLDRRLAAIEQRLDGLERHADLGGL